MNKSSTAEILSAIGWIFFAIGLCIVMGAGVKSCVEKDIKQAEIKANSKIKEVETYLQNGYVKKMIPTHYQEVWVIKDSLLLNGK